SFSSRKNTQTYFFSSKSNIPQQAVVIENGQITYQSEEIPNWVQTTLTKLEERASNRSQIATNFPTTPANIDSGKYVGTVSQTTNNYIVQQTGDSRILHDRSIVKGEFETGDNIRIAYRDGNVAATVQPTQENQQWAESILPIATNILQVRRQENRVENPSRGIELVRENNYQLQLNRNNETLTISSVADNRTVASYDLAESTVIAANPTVQDKQYWLSRSQ
ncbi:MAG: KfrB domain-containing protein, partial [Scytonema sp. PMC 1069.18]|nr:KfrB domain-containing protein [Scytonema sp. PMC 1069.18]MEC4884782.1 KfrB domain-containing protein [Scytonema sp. PMC 1070.18]